MSNELGIALDVPGFVQKVCPADVSLQGNKEPAWSRFTWILQARSQGARASVLFRGQEEAAWDLQPGIDREKLSAYRRRRTLARTEHELAMFREFKRAARRHVPVEPRDDWEWLAVAQHHGLATRLLDWTTNPLAALFFAVDAAAQCDSAVWIYAPMTLAPPDVGPFHIKAVCIYEPPHVDDRISAQGGCFSVHPTEVPDWAGELGRITIPRERRDPIRRQLRSIGITRSLLFPGLDSLARHINGVGF